MTVGGVFGLGIAVVVGAAFGAWLTARTRRPERLLAETRRELARRLNDFFSLQELAYMLAESIQTDRIAEQVAQYTTRFLPAEGALVLLESGGPERVEVAGAVGLLQSQAGRQFQTAELGELVTRAMEAEQLAVASSKTDPPLGFAAVETVLQSAAVAPLTAHGFTLGAVVIAARAPHAFGVEDLRLLSTVATHAALALSNARFFQFVQRAKTEWETTFDAIADGVALIDPRGRVRRCNRALATLLHETVDDMVGVDLAEALLGQPTDLSISSASGEAGSRSQPLTLRSATLNRTFRITGAPLGGTFGAGWRVVLVEDVTDEKALEAQLIQSDKMASIGQLVSGVAHELNNPLTSIAGLSEFLLEQGHPDPRHREHLQVIFEQADRAANIVHSLLAFARKGPVKTEEVDLTEVARRTTDLMAHELAMRHIDLEVALDDGLPPVRGDRYQLQQVTLNLLTNAVQALGDLPGDARRVVRVATARDGRDVILRVEDTGPGISPELLPKIFDPFVTTRQARGGTGLGLSVSYRLIEGHSGTLTVEQPAGGGSAFVIRLPCARRSDPVATPETPVASEARARASGPRRVLLVDADPGVRRTIAALFASEGHEVEAAADALHALSLLATNTYDLVIADARAAVSAGESFVQSYFADHPDAKARTILLTADVRPETDAWLRELDVPFFHKPFAVRDLRATAHGILEGDATGNPAARDDR